MHLNVEKKWVGLYPRLHAGAHAGLFRRSGPGRPSTHEGLRWQKTAVEPATAGGER